MYLHEYLRKKFQREKCSYVEIFETQHLYSTKGESNQRRLN